jgi:hypothetical protein
MDAPMLTPQMAREADAACVFTNLRTVTDLATTIFDKTLEPAQVTVEQLGYLVCIHGLTDISVDDMASRKAQDADEVRAALLRMQYSGWVELPESNSQPLRLTDAGLAKLDEGAGLWADTQSHIVDAVGGEARWHEIIGNLSELFASIRAVG